jgi:hypothetical protein
MAKQANQKKGSSRKVGRKKRSKDMATSNFVREKISFEQYAKAKNIKTKTG